MKPPHSPSNSSPQSFTQVPGGLAGRRPEPVAARVVGVGLPRSVPMLTVYADGRVHLGKEAALLLRREAAGVCFYAPETVRPGCRPGLWEVAGGECHLLREAGPEHTQLRAAGHCPPPGRYLFTPTATPGRYALVPTG